ncbi:MAG TPA: DNA mismatch repair endonuclease MutL [Candidatus Rubrimentiphilum sp.]|nr:DNA mismatch repair endonuclease MutL [Candidatus Rubrimentiphilum sp.]
MIRVLDALTVGQIAAGEVIERPASVVKELVENSIDAGADRITVRLEDGGISFIEVADNGSGIAPEELPLAIRRHATSKLAVAGDLQSIATLGFRGEGLASIAAVCELEIVSRTAQNEIGARVAANAAETSTVTPAPGAIGTAVRARNIFANVPVRREFLKSPSAELARISSWLSTLALGYPAVTFSLHNDGKELFTLPAAGDVQARLSYVFGRSAAESLIPLEGAAARSMHGSLRGFISTPGNDRADRRLQLLFVNDRLLRSAQLAGAWTAGYTTFAMTGRQPYGVLFLSLPPDHVDPNVHPTKSDVRFRYGQHVFDTVRRSIAATLRAHAGLRLTDALAVSPSPASFNGDLASPQQLLAEIPASESGPAVLAQIDRTYILATDSSNLILIDQHAAHERIAYEKIMAAAQMQTPPVEQLLVPITFELTAERAAILESVLEPLREGGLEIESFGERSYRITATPAGYGARAFDIASFLDDLSDEPRERTAHERVWASLACHSVTRAGERLEHAEMSALAKHLQGCENPMHCPHGRPTVVRLDATALSRLFKR